MDRWEPVGSTLFRLVRDGAPTPYTSWTDPTSSRGEQLDHLRRTLPWLPDQALTATVDRVVGGSASPPGQVPALAPDRLFAPPPAGCEVAVLPQPGDGAAPLRAWFWPVIDSRGNPQLEPGEAVIAQEKMKLSMGPSGMFSEDYVQCWVTSHRLIAVGAWHTPVHPPPNNWAEGLGLVSHSLQSAYAGEQSLRRIGRLPGRFWVRHIRYEWISRITLRTIFSPPKRALLGTFKSNRWWWTVAVRDATGAETEFEVAFVWEGGKASAPTSAKGELAERLGKHLEAAARTAGGHFDLVDRSVRETKEGPEERQTWSVNPLAGFSIPAGLAATT